MGGEVVQKTGFTLCPGLVLLFVDARKEGRSVIGDQAVVGVDRSGRHGDHFRNPHAKARADGSGLLECQLRVGGHVESLYLARTSEPT